MPRTFEFSLPNDSERAAILCVLLAGEIMDESVEIEKLSKMTTSYSGSDLKEWCRFAAMIPIREILRHQRQRESSMENIAALEDGNQQPRPVTLEDFVVALDHVKPSGAAASEYQIKRMSAALH
jgi:ATPase family AAA domain-containing protein 1